MASLFSARTRFTHWRELWITLATCQRELGVPISEAQIETLRSVVENLDLVRIAELERETRHDVVAHLRHFAEQAGKAGAILHLGATSAFVTDNTDLILIRQALRLLLTRLATAISKLSGFAKRTRSIPTLAYTHLQPAQLTTVGKRVCLWIQDLVTDLEEIKRRHAEMRCRGVKGTTGTQASFLTLFKGDGDKVRQLDQLLSQRLGFSSSWPLTGQTYPRKQDSQTLAALAGLAESCHKLGTDLRLLQGLGELREPFDALQVGSSAMAYKRNPIRSERLCSLSRRVLTDALNGPLNAATQWLERSLDDSANRRLVLPDALMTCDAMLGLTASIACGLQLDESTIASRVARELPFMATETFLVEGTLRGADRQELHEEIRRLSLKAHEAVARGEQNPLLDAIAADARFGLTRQEIDARVDPRAFTGRSTAQVEEFLEGVVDPALQGLELATVEEPRV